MGNGLQNVFRRGKKQEPPATDLNTTAVGQHHQQQPAQYGMTYSLEPPHLSAYAFHASPCYMDTYNTPVNHQVAGPYDEALAYTSPSAPSVQASTGPPPTSPEKRTLPQPQGVANQAAVETFDKASSASRGPRTPRASSLPRPSKSTPGAENPTAASPSSAAGRKPLAHKGVPSPLPRKPISPRKEQPTSEAPPTPDIPPTPPRKSDQFDTVVAQELNAGQDAKYQLEITPPVGQLTIPSSSRVDPPLTPTLVPPKPLDSAVESHPLGPVSSPGAASGSSLLPPVARHPLDTPNPQGLDQEPTRDVKGWLLDQQVSTEQLHQVTPPTERPSHYVIDRPTCSINLVCYRSGAKGCSRKQIQCVLRSRFPDEESYEKMVSANGHLMQTDVEFFEEARRLFEHEMCDFFRRWFSLKSLRAFRVLAVELSPPHKESEDDLT